MLQGSERISRERNEQLFKHKHSINRDVVKNDQSQLRIAAIKLIGFVKDGEGTLPRKPFNWNPNTWKHMCQKPLKERLIIAGALIAAEYDRLCAIESRASQ
jgi:hypothetical protein